MALAQSAYPLHCPAYRGTDDTVYGLWIDSNRAGARIPCIGIHHRLHFRWWWRWEADGGIEDGFFDVSLNIPEEERNIERRQPNDKLRDELLKAAKALGKR